jgi:hypothetical protein
MLVNSYIHRLKCDTAELVFIRLLNLEPVWTKLLLSRELRESIAN